MPQGDISPDSEHDPFRPLLIMEAIHSAAMAHTHGHGGCDVCAAASGDQDALLRVFTAVRDAR